MIDTSSPTGPSPDSRRPVLEEQACPGPAVRGEGLLRRLENGFLRVDRVIERALPASLNPFAQLGAMANICLIIAVISGVWLLFWYTPSVHQAHASLEHLRTGSFIGQWVRSLHRYSSDGCMFFILLHALRIVFQRRFTGARWPAWTTGLLLLVAVWFIGWTGYWLVWDVRGQHAALGTARMLDRLPLFTEPPTRMFLTDASVPSLLFFIVFFLHMLLPLALGVGLWMHLMRVNRARFLTGRALTLWVVGSLAVLSVLLPATSAAPARMTEKAAAFSIDWWYLWPLVLTDRLGGGMLWAVFLGVGIVAFTVPWWMVKRRRAPAWRARVEPARCFGCTLCARDCPFNAIDIIPREDGKAFSVQALVNPDLCVGCGICAGSCDSQAINLPALNSRAVEGNINAWIEKRKHRNEPAFVAFCCSESAAAGFRADGEGRSSEPPGWRIEPVPCVGWVGADMLERLVNRGATGILVVGCGEGDPVAREGGRWFGQRMEGVREPAFDPRKADSARVRFVQVNRTDRPAWLRAALEFQQGRDPRPKAASVASPVRRLAVAAVLSLVLAGVTYGLSNLPYRAPHAAEPELVVSFNHVGAVLEARSLTREELDKRLPHMRAQVNVSRTRAPVRLRVWVDDRLKHDERYHPQGLSGDGPGVAILRMPMAPGTHRVRVEISSDSATLDSRNHVWEQPVEFVPRRVRVILFDTKAGFSMH